MSLRSGSGAPEPEPDPAKINEDVQLALLEIEAKGRLTPLAVVEAARDSGSPLHEFFEWDDTEAAASWRIEQARRLIRRVAVIVERDKESICVPRYVRDTLQQDDEAGYVSIPKLQTEPANSKALLRYEMTRALGYVERAVSLARAIGFGPDVVKLARLIQLVLKRLT